MDKEKIEREAWKLALISSGVHLRRIVEMYEELGLDVNLEDGLPPTLASAGQEQVRKGGK